MITIDKLIKSRTFEKGFYFLRKHIPYLSRKYNQLHNINIKKSYNVNNPDIKNSINIAEDGLEKLYSATNKPTNNKFNNTPKKIWLYWNSPLEEAPEVVRVSVESWIKLNPDYNVTLLNDNNLNDVLGFDFNAIFKIATVNLGFAMKADILRLYLLATQGGVWADTTTFCLKPLSSWLDYEIEKAQFFAFRHNSNKTRPIEAWFLASPPSSPIIKKTLELFLSHLFKPRVNSLMLSNRIKSLGLSDRDNERFYADVVFKAEKVGFMPYFSVGYFFNEAFKQSETIDAWARFNSTSNNHVVNNDELEKFELSYVSKQTYKGDYQNSDIFKERVNHMNLLTK
ncbi:glycosyltransferase family 32 protein [Vibrio apostichopi]|uniref:glycosyltransferase family 32 protein n=1 Tax=Vibrio apostichopi TaxID=3035453 RepID=UPI002572898A|nr:capsular polysaccharide synthesis protein [Vibrio sp. FE10]